MITKQRFSYFCSVLEQRPDAVAVLSGSADYPQLYGQVRFYQTHLGVLIATDFTGLPTGAGACDSPIFGFHIHSGTACTGNADDPFADALTHYNPHTCPHPYHAGDLPPVFGNDGVAFSVTLTNRFTVEEVVGKVIILHASPDDFTTQPAGNSGSKIACGSIRLY